MKPHRVRLSRKKGWTKPDNTVVVARPTMWGNPFVPGKDGIPDRETAVAKFRAITETPGWSIGQMTAEAVRLDLRGKNLACWCSLDGPCHADVLLEIANAD
jgi:hypothetical protein